MVLYLCGKMSGEECHGFPAFDVSALQLRRAGYDVISPADMDRIVHIHEFTDLDTLPPGWKRDAMKRDTAAICDHADGIALIDTGNWHTGRGTQAELALAACLDIPCHTVDEWIVQARLHEEENGE